MLTVMTKTKACSKSQGSHDSGVAICNNIMRAGKHSVSFYMNNPRQWSRIALGIMRPTTKDITSLRKCHPAVQDLSVFSLKEYDILHSNNVDCCLFNTYNGNGFIRRRWKQWTASELMAMDEEQREQAEAESRCLPFRWAGQEPTVDDTSFKIGLALDLDKGTLDVYKNDRRLGTMKNGLVGEYCWVVSMPLLSLDTDAEVSVSIGRFGR